MWVWMGTDLVTSSVEERGGLLWGHVGAKISTAKPSPVVLNIIVEWKCFAVNKNHSSNLSWGGSVPVGHPSANYTIKQRSQQNAPCHRPAEQPARKTVKIRWPDWGFDSGRSVAGQFSKICQGKRKGNLPFPHVAIGLTSPASDNRTQQSHSFVILAATRTHTVHSLSEISNTAVHQLLILEVHADQDDTLILWRQRGGRTCWSLITYYFIKAQSGRGGGGDATISLVETVSSQTWGCWENTVLTGWILASKMRLGN